MKVYVPNISNTSIGGGWTFLANLNKAAQLSGMFELTDDANDFDVLFAFAPTTVDGETIARAKKDGKPFVLRMDGVPEDSRNSGRGTRRMVEYAMQADFIVYQTDFIQRTVGRILHDIGVKAPGRVIYNGVDTETFTNKGGKLPLEGKFKILHVNYRKDNNKRVEEVIQMYRELWTYRKDTNLILMGRYPTEWTQYGMGFFSGERAKTIGVVTDDSYKAMVMRSCDVLFYPSYADPAPNVVLEAMACGLPIYYQAYGGVDEMVPAGGGVMISGVDDYSAMMEIVEAKRDEMSFAVRQAAEKQFSLASMGANYGQLFQFVAESL